MTAKLCGIIRYHLLQIWNPVACYSLAKHGYSIHYSITINDHLPIHQSLNQTSLFLIVQFGLGS
jgi:hypothetical protein